MKVLGIDPATMIAAIAVVVDGEPTQVVVWKGGAKDSQFRRLTDWQEFVQYKVSVVKPNLVVIAESSFQRNMETVRALARSEAVAIIASIDKSDAVVTAKDTQIRSIVWPDDKVKKDEVFTKLKKLHPKLKWQAQDRGGQDQADALAAALAGPTILERKLK
jgi:Holliday junction resolvasome RuvABC endonuclease subunit